MLIGAGGGLLAVFGHDPERLVFNPYDYDGAEIAGQVELVPPEAATGWGLLTKLDLAGRLVLTKGRPNPYRMAFRKPRAMS